MHSQKLEQKSRTYLGCFYSDVLNLDRLFVILFVWLVTLLK